MSEYTNSKARRLLDGGKVAAVGDGVWQVAGSAPGTLYVVTLSPPYCDCKGFMFRNDCSHVRAAALDASRNE